MATVEENLDKLFGFAFFPDSPSLELLNSVA